MQDRFKDVPVEVDTHIIFENRVKLEDIDVLYQKWLWDGIEAQSIIFLSTDIEGMSDEELEEFVRGSYIVKVGSQITIQRGKKYTFVNFNFELQG